MMVYAREFVGDGDLSGRPVLMRVRRIEVAGSMSQLSDLPLRPVLMQADSCQLYRHAFGTMSPWAESYFYFFCGWLSEEESAIGSALGKGAVASVSYSVSCSE